jgi:hypothetical protein
VGRRETLAELRKFQQDFKEYRDNALGNGGCVAFTADTLQIAGVEVRPIC